MKRIQFEVTQEGWNELEKLMKDTGITTKKEVLNNAISLLDWAVAEKKKGHMIASIDESNSKYKEIILPSFKNISK